MDNYVPVLLHTLIAVGFATVTLITSRIVGRSGRSNPTKASAYECGMPTMGDVQPRFSIKFYLVAMLFILFDIEIVFMYPWAVVFREYIAGSENPTVIFMSMLSFVTILMIAFVYAVKKGALDWSK